MYTRFFKLRSNPFGMTPDPGCLFLTRQHREAFAGLTYTILGRRGFGVLTGDAGTGKTTLVGRVLAALPRDKVQARIIFHPTLSTSDFLELLLLDFGITEIPDSKARRLACLRAFLLENQQAGKISTLIVDEAHKLGHRLLEEVRLLGNFAVAEEKLLQIVLVGQTELDEMLTQNALRQLKQRIAVRLRIDPLPPDQVESYLRYRWLKAGGSEPLPFSSTAIAEIIRPSSGLPRVINAVCDNALLLAFSEQARNVELEHVRQSAADLRYSAKSSHELSAAGQGVVAPDFIRQIPPAAVQRPPVAVAPDVPGPIRLPETLEVSGRPS